MTLVTREMNEFHEWLWNHLENILEEEFGPTGHYVIGHLIDRYTRDTGKAYPLSKSQEDLRRIRTNRTYFDRADLVGLDRTADPPTHQELDQMVQSIFGSIDRTTLSKKDQEWVLRIAIGLDVGYTEVTELELTRQRDIVAKWLQLNADEPDYFAVVQIDLTQPVTLVTTEKGVTLSHFRIITDISEWRAGAIYAQIFYEETRDEAAKFWSKYLPAFLRNF